MDVTALAPAAIASLIAAAFAFAGILLAAFNTRWVDANSSFVAAFAAGVLITSVLVHLIPAALGNGWVMGFAIVGGYVAMYLLGELLPHGDHGPRALAADTEMGDAPAARGGVRLAAVSLIAIGIHSLVDGLEYPVLYSKDLSTGVLSSSGLILHELAEGIIVYALLRTAGLSRPLGIVLATIAAALTTPFGTYISLVLLEGVSEPVMALVFALAAGSVLYVGSTHLPRHIQPQRRLAATIPFLIGVALAVAFSLGHGAHDHAGGHHGHAHDHHDHHHGHIDDLERPR